MIRFPREKIITEWHEVTPEEFVDFHLMEIRIYDGKYHFYISDGINKGMISYACEYHWKDTNFDLCEFDPYNPKDPLQLEIRDDIIMFLKSFEV